MNNGFFKIHGTWFWHIALNGVDMTLPIIFVLTSIIGSVIYYFIVKGG